MKKTVISVLIATATVTAAAQTAPLTGTPISSDYINGRDASTLFDGDRSTWFQAGKPDYSWAGLDLGEPHVITRVGYLPYNTSLSVLALFEGANNPDFSDAVPLYMVTERPEDISRMLYGDVTCSRGVRYVRYCGPADSRSVLRELEFYGIPGEGNSDALWQVTNLPTVVINTENAREPFDKETDIKCNVVIISDGGATELSAPATVRERGNASRSFPKKPWRIKFDKKQQPLGAPAKAKKWTLINNYGDKSLMRNILAFEAARMLDMEYVPFCRPVDVILNGQYKGCYQFCDQVEVGKGRVDIEEMTPEDAEGDALTGGYFVEVDAYADQELSWFTTGHYAMPVTIKSPDDDEIIVAQHNYIKDYFDFIEGQLKSSADGSYDATDPETGYRRIFDTPSFIRHMLVNEIAGNTDAYWSTYMYKHRTAPKVYTGPVWDFDLGFDNDSRTFPVTRTSGDGYLWDSGRASAANGMYYFAHRILVKDPTTAGEIHDIWREARRNGLSAEAFIELIDETEEELSESARLNFTRWPILDRIEHQNPRAAGTYAGEVQYLRDYILDQMPHLDEVIGYDPNEVDPDDPEDSIDGVEGDEPMIRIVGRRVITEGFEPGTRYAVYGIDGRLAAAGTCGSPSTDLAPGVYIVSTPGHVAKVLAK